MYIPAGFILINKILTSIKLLLSTFALPNSVGMTRILILLFFCCYIAEAQNVQVNATGYTPQQLIEDVLINNACIGNVTVTNTVSGNFGGTMKSFGYFDAAGTTFPFEKGIVLSTGRLDNVPGPNTSLSDDDANNWGGDADLNAVLGINNTLNATVLEFDFTPTGNTLNFNYIFASEEYQENNSNTCIYSDVFAFLIKPIGGTYTNIAVVPNTNTPVQVTTVHPEIPGGCAAENEAYFGSWNNSTAPINFNGQTAVLTAEATVTPNTTYHIKLIIADEQNYRYDSAVFLEAESFNISAELGEDRTIQNQNPLCENETLLLSPNIQGTPVSYTWYKDGNVITGATSNEYTVTTTGTYSIDVTLINGCIASDEIVVEYATSTNINPITLTQCDPNGDGLTTYNLTDANAIVHNIDPDMQLVGYYTSLLNAENETNPINNPYSYHNSTANQIVYTNVVNRFGCHNTLAITLSANSNYIAPIYLTTCDTDENDGFTSFNLNEAGSQIIAGLPQGSTVTYYESEDDAYLNNNPVSTTYTNTIANHQTIYTRIESQEQCFGISAIYLSVSNPPNLPEDKITYYCTNQYPEPLRLYAGVAGNPQYYTFLWNTGATTSYIDITATGNYQVTVTNDSGCSATRSFNVLESSLPNLSISISGNYGHNTVTLTTDGIGEYQYAIDSQDFNDENIFNGLAIGQHTAYVIDNNGCGIISQDFFLIDFPKYFTPNNDGINDFWNILGGNFENSAIKNIAIFDRFGKLLYVINQNDTGWNGNYNGALMPSDDYWFSVNFVNGGSYRNNFSLIR